MAGPTSGYWGAQATTFSFADLGSGGAGKNVTLTIAAPSGIQSGDLILLVVMAGSSQNNQVSTFTTPTGFTKAGSSTDSSYTGDSFSVFYRTASASEPSSYSVVAKPANAGNSVSFFAGMAVRQGGANFTTDTLGTVTRTGSTLTWPATSTTSGQQPLLIVEVGALDMGTTGTSPSAAQWPNVAPSGYVVAGEAQAANRACWLGCNIITTPAGAGATVPAASCAGPPLTSSSSVFMSMTIQLSQSGVGTYSPNYFSYRY